MITAVGPTLTVGKVLTVTVVEAVEIHPFAPVTVTLYVPLAAVVAVGIDGFCKEELNPFGPVQL
jgi:hypothetical protein